MSPEPVVTTHDLVVEYGTRGAVRAVDGVDLVLHRGETLAVVGESGCGKSTLGKALLRLVDITGGTVEFGGRRVASLRGSALKEFRSQAQMVFQDPYGSLNPRWRIGHSIAEPLRGRGMSRTQVRERVSEVLDLVGLDPSRADRFPHEFSGGQRQRINIGRAIASDPAFIVCDEAVSALDVSVQAQILNLLRSLQERSSTANLFVSHDLSVVRFIADRVLVLYLGQVMEEAGTTGLFENPRHPYTRSLFSALPSVHADGRRERIVLGGEPPSPIDRPRGCPFASRCPVAEPECVEDRPTVRTLPDGARIACHRVRDDGTLDYEFPVVRAA